MKKIRLNVANLEATEILSREQLKSIFGGSGSGSAGGNECTTLTQDACVNTVSCKDSYGVEGKCGWSAGSFNRCTCATVSIG